MSIIEMKINKDEQATLKILESPLLSNHQNSMIICFVKANSYLKMGMCEKALNILEKRPTGKEFYNLASLHYLHGIAKMQRLDKDADTPLLHFISSFKGINYIKSAFQKLAWHSLLHNDIKKYHHYMEQCRKKGNMDVDEDKQAEHEATDGGIPNVYLLKARLLFDGGFYNKSLKQLTDKTNQQFPAFRDKLEYSYRMARIHHQLNHYGKAIAFYEFAIKNGSELSYHFAANSCLHLAYIYEEQKNTKMAEKYFLKCLSLKKHDYQNSIDQKAKLGLARIKSN
jgi:tetratricopeptide (TPR) repeat protein